MILDADLARLYGVPTKALVRAVKRNVERFPPDFMFQLDSKEVTDLRRQTGTSSMLSSVLRSAQAVKVNVEIMRAFVRLRAALADHRDLARRLDELEAKYDLQFKVVFDAIRALMTPPEKPARRIGFRAERKQ